MVVKPRIIGINMIVRNIDVPLCFAFRLPPAPRERAIGDTWLAASRSYEDHGAPGERAVYHPGYYGAFVLDRIVSFQR